MVHPRRNVEVNQMLTVGDGVWVSFKHEVYTPSVGMPPRSLTVPAVYLMWNLVVFALASTRSKLSIPFSI